VVVDLLLAMSRELEEMAGLEVVARLVGTIPQQAARPARAATTEQPVYFHLLTENQSEQVGAEEEQVDLVV
jgi:hypothetical protein